MGPLMKEHATDYETFTKIKWELLQPIREDGLDVETLKRLYESKLVYLEHLRVKCFTDMNLKVPTSYAVHDYLFIFEAIQKSKTHLRELVRTAVVSILSTPVLCAKLHDIGQHKDV